MSDQLAPLKHFVTDMSAVVARAGTDEAIILEEGAALLGQLVGRDAGENWLPEPYAGAAGDSYGQYLLYRAPAGGFSVVSFVWAPGQSTPVHDHTVWGLVGVLRGQERNVPYERADDGRLTAGAPEILSAGEVCAVSPTIGDIHQVSNALTDETSISIHVYGADIGEVKRHTFDPETGAATTFVSGYSDAPIPDLS